MDLLKNVYYAKYNENLDEHDVHVDEVGKLWAKIMFSCNVPFMLPIIQLCYKNILPRSIQTRIKLIKCSAHIEFTLLPDVEKQLRQHLLPVQPSKRVEPPSRLCHYSLCPKQQVLGHAVA